MAQLYGPRFLPSAWLREKAARGEAFYAPAEGASTKEAVPA
jgi:3-hydroxyacyl-CoA dehydrogenase/enoyl-CoA hydratase/3-hydroxybutyryl-CoA epimerase